MAHIKKSSGLIVKVEHITLTVNESPALFILITRSCPLCGRLTPWDNANPVRLPGFRYYGCWITCAPLNYLYRCVFKWAEFQCPHWLSSFPRNEAENEKMTDKLQNIFFNGNKIDGLNFKDRGGFFFLNWIVSIYDCSCVLIARDKLKLATSWISEHTAGG